MKRPTEEAWQAVEKLLRAYQNLGTRLADSGARLVGRAPHVASEAWLHVTFPCLSTAEADLALPKIYRNRCEFEGFLREHSNGLSLFCDTLALHGYRARQGRGDAALWQPFDLAVINTKERPAKAVETQLFFASYSWDGSLVYEDVQTAKVSRCTRDSADALQTWDSFSTFLRDESNRIAALFDRSGRKRDASAATVPQ